MNNLENTLKSIIDFLFPKLDAYEQMFYMYLFRNTILENKSEILVPLSSIHKKVGFGIGRLGSQVSRQVVRNKFKSLEEKNCIKLLERTKSGLKYKVYLPEEIPGVIIDVGDISEVKDIENIDFYKIRENKKYLLERENQKCFYCDKKISVDNYAVDHVIPQMDYGTNSYKNCVAACLDCNSLKQGQNADDFSRYLYRENLIRKDEFDILFLKIKDLKEGKLKPKITDD